MNKNVWRKSGLTQIPLSYLLSILIISVVLSACTGKLRKVEVVDFKINDSKGGNNDGKINPGEQINLSFQLKNISQKEINQSKATLFTSHSGIEIIEGTAQFPPIKPEESAGSESAYTVFVGENVQATSAAFYLESISGACFRATFPFEITQEPREFSVEIIRIIIDDSLGGNDNKKLNPGETANLQIQLKNIGVDTIPPSGAMLSTSRTDIHIIDPFTAFPDTIFPGQTVSSSSSDPIVVTIDDNAKAGIFIWKLESTTAGVSYTAQGAGQIYEQIYACLDTSAVIRGVPTAAVPSPPDTLLIRLAICNDSGDNISSVLVTIAEEDVWICGDQSDGTRNTPFDAVADTVEYGLILDTHCAPPHENSPAKEFRYTVSLGSITGFHCFYFYGEIFEGSTFRNDFELGCTIIVPAP